MADQPQTESKQPKCRRFLGIMKWIFGTSIALFGLFYGIFGPPWPTTPEFSPGLPSSGSPLDVPFIVTNHSALFKVIGLSISCRMNSGHTLHGKVFNGVTTISASDGNTLRPAETRSYTCQFNRVITTTKGDHFVRAELQFLTEYDSPWPLRPRKHGSSDIFTLNTATSPAQWTPGKPLD